MVISILYSLVVESLNEASGLHAHLQAMAGLASDGRQIVAKARGEASNYRRY